MEKFLLGLLIVLLAAAAAWWTWRRFGGGAVARRRRIQQEDALKHLFHCDYRKRAATIESLAGSLGVSGRQAAMIGARLQAEGLARAVERGFRLTEEGRGIALHLVRAHRLYETHLARETGLSEEDWHHRAESAEHRMSDEDVNALADRLGRPRFDPHGDPIPTRCGAIPESRGSSLIDWPSDQVARIVHIEDEPEAVYAELVKLGLAAGMTLQVTGQGRTGYQAQLEGRQIHLSIPMAACLTVEALPVGDQAPENVTRLTELPTGARSTVIGLSPACLGPERRRLLDLGVVPGTIIGREFESPFHSPSAFRIRGSLIALRKRQTDRILIDASSNEPIE